MNEAITRYFDGEKLGGLALVVIGLVALAGVALLLRSNYRGAIIPLGLIALLQLGIGTGLYLRTDRQVEALRAQLERSPAEYKTLEGQRMNKVMRSFIMIELVELALLAASIAIAFLYKERAMLFAASLAVIGQSGVMLIFDLTAEARGRPYAEAIARLTS